jgi:hypothetical protein
MRRLPLTTVSVLLFGVYSLVSLAIRRIKLYFAKKILQYSVLPKEILGEILNDVVADPSTSLTELSNLSLVCREWNKFVSDNNIWLKMVNLKWMKIKSKATDLHIHIIFQSTARLFTPKLSYALLNYRIPIYNYYANGSVLGDVTFREFPADLMKLRSNKFLWVPWLNHNILERPETLRKFICYNKTS